jgi:hypothetical protein
MLLETVRETDEECILLDPSQDDRWDHFVQKHRHGWIVHTSGWKRVVETCFHHIRGFCPAIIDRTTNEIIAGLPLYKVNSWLTGKRLVSIPFATLSDPLITNESDRDMLLEKALSLAEENGSARLEIRGFQSSLMRRDPHFAYSCYYKNHFIPLSTDLGLIWKSFHRSNVRQRIQRAESSGLTIRAGNSEADIARFYSLYIITRKKLRLPLQPSLFFELLWKTFGPSGNLELLLAELNRETTAALLLLKFKDRVSAEYLAWDDRYSQISPNHLLFWEAIKKAHDEGFRVFDFGRTSIRNESLMSFKSRWGSRILDLYEAVYPKQAMKTDIMRDATFAFRMVQIACRYCPESALSLLSRICYRHLG